MRNRRGYLMDKNDKLTNDKLTKELKEAREDKIWYKRWFDALNGQLTTEHHKEWITDLQQSNERLEKEVASLKDMTDDAHLEQHKAEYQLELAEKEVESAYSKGWKASEDHWDEQITFLTAKLDVAKEALWEYVNNYSKVDDYLMEHEWKCKFEVAISKLNETHHKKEK